MPLDGLGPNCQKRRDALDALGLPLRWEADHHQLRLRRPGHELAEVDGDMTPIAAQLGLDLPWETGRDRDLHGSIRRNGLDALDDREVVQELPSFPRLVSMGLGKHALSRAVVLPGEGISICRMRNASIPLDALALVDADLGRSSGPGDARPAPQTLSRTARRTASAASMSMGGPIRVRLPGARLSPRAGSRLGFGCTPRPTLAAASREDPSRIRLGIEG
jgi:hypothetical protein